MGWLWYHTKLIKEVKKYKKLAREAEETSRFVKNYILEDWFKLLGTHINKVRQNLRPIPRFFITGKELNILRFLVSGQKEFPI